MMPHPVSLKILKALYQGFRMTYHFLHFFYWNLKWKWEYLGSERPQTKFSEGGAFLVNWAVAPPRWCHTQFLYRFWKLRVRAFKWYLICGFFSTGKFFKWTKQETLNLSVPHSFSGTVPIPFEIENLLKGWSFLRYSFQRRRIRINIYQLNVPSSILFFLHLVLL